VSGFTALLLFGEGAIDPGAGLALFVGMVAVVPGFFVGLLITSKALPAAQVALITGGATGLIIWLSLLEFNEGQLTWPIFVAPIPAVLAAWFIARSGRT
jgi:hypothetical protein